MPITIIRKEMVGTVETDVNDKGSKYPETNLTQVLCFWYLITFQKKSVLALLYSDLLVNAIYLIFVQKSRLLIKLTDIQI